MSMDGNRQKTFDAELIANNIPNNQEKLLTVTNRNTAQPFLKSEVIKIGK